jgi:hypothetical protein
MNIVEKLCFSILPLLITALLYSVVTRKQKEREKFIDASNKFREAFFDEIRFINRDYAVDRAGRDIPEVLAAAADKHETALIAFMEVLNKRKKTNIKKAWNTYTGNDKVTGKYTFRQYATYNKFKDAENIRQRALDRIDDILKFAKPKH